MRIEEAMLALDQGQIEVDRVQQISKQGVHVKYKAELASQSYTSSVAAINQVVRQFPASIKPCMSQLQQIETNRVNRLQKSIEGMMNNLKVFGTAV